MPQHTSSVGRSGSRSEGHAASNCDEESAADSQTKERKIHDVYYTICHVKSEEFCFIVRGQLLLGRGVSYKALRVRQPVRPL